MNEIDSLELMTPNYHHAWAQNNSRELNARKRVVRTYQLIFRLYSRSLHGEIVAQNYFPF